MAKHSEAQAKSLLLAQADVLSCYAAAVEQELGTGSAHSAALSQRLKARAELARDMAGVLFRAATHAPTDSGSGGDEAAPGEAATHRPSAQ